MDEHPSFRSLTTGSSGTSVVRPEYAALARLLRERVGLDLFCGSG